MDSNQLVFTFKLVRGPSSKSFGINVALAAGLPLRILQRAKEKSEEFEAQCRSRTKQASVATWRTRHDEWAHRDGLCTRRQHL